MTTGSFSSQAKDDIHFIAESDAIPLHVPVASRSVTNLCKVSSTSSALCDLAKPTLQPLYTNLPSSTTNYDTKAHKISEKSSWSEGVSMAFCRNAASTADGSHDDLNKYGLFSNRSRVINYSLNHEQTNQSLMSSFPSFLMNSNIISAALQAGPSFFHVASRKSEKPLGVHPNCHDESAHAIRSTQLSKRTFLISQITSPIVQVPENLTTLPDMNAIVPKVNNIPDRYVSNCCSPSSKSSHQISIPDDNVSESGWTKYLNQSTDLIPGRSSTELSHSNSRALSQVTRHLLDKSSQHKQHPVRRNLIANFEDFSMVSDASSGPEHPFLYEDTQEIFKDSAVHKKEFGLKVFTGVRIDDLMDDACASKINCENIFNGLTSTGWRTSKRRKRDLLVKPCPPLHDIPKRKEKPQVEDGENYCDSFEGSGDNLNVEHKSTDSQNIDRAEILAVAIDYVKSLEQKIKTFETSRTDMAADEHRNAESKL